MDASHCSLDDALGVFPSTPIPALRGSGGSACRIDSDGALFEFPTAALPHGDPPTLSPQPEGLASVQGFFTPHSTTAHPEHEPLLRSLCQLQEQHQARLEQLLVAQREYLAVELKSTLEWHWQQHERPHPPLGRKPASYHLPPRTSRRSMAVPAIVDKVLDRGPECDPIPEHAHQPPCNGTWGCQVRKNGEDEKTDKVVGDPRPRASIVGHITKFADEIAQMTALHQEIRAGQETGLQGSRFGHMKQFISCRPFEITVCLIICLNAVVLGVQVDSDVKHGASETNPSFRTLTIFFMVFFSLELFCRVLGEGPMFFMSRKNPRVGWNIFDTMLVTSALGEELFSVLLAAAPNVTSMRMFRMLRLVRIFRIVRVMRFFRDLRVMCAGIVNSLQALIWAVLLLLAMMYLFAVCLLQFVAEEVTRQSDGSGLGEEDFANLEEYFGGLVCTVYTLYLAIVGGIDWGRAAEPLIAMHWIFGLSFALYVAFAVLCVLNIVTGVFVESANKLTAQDQDMVLMEELETRRQWFEEVKVLFEAADVDGSGCLNEEEFGNQLKDLRMQSWFRKLGIHVETYSAHGLFQLLDFDGDGALELDEFAIALQQVHGPARSIDVAKVTHDTRILRKDVADLLQLVQAMVPAGTEQIPTQWGHDISVYSSRSVGERPAVGS